MQPMFSQSRDSNRSRYNSITIQMVFNHKIQRYLTRMPLIFNQDINDNQSGYKWYLIKIQLISQNTIDNQSRYSINNWYSITWYNRYSVMMQMIFNQDTNGVQSRFRWYLLVWTGARNARESKIRNGRLKRNFSNNVCQFLRLSAIINLTRDFAKKNVGMVMERNSICFQSANQ